ncbi:MAG: RIP metalloprotease [Chloroflexi bacterium]|nr:RIP metalloprotease [Chloroflexota bacterium]HEV8053341.1 M50 family metallopeptidase [Candidatus Limnocylindrales bacterium]
MQILDGLINVTLLLAILVLLVVVHEFGHFVMARRAGVRVHEFGIGFPPRAKIFARDKETIYTLNWLPIGGFVRLEGEEGESSDPRSFVRQSLATRLVILLAGVAMNLLLAWLIFSFIAGVGDPTTKVRIGTVPTDPAGPSPAQQLGLVGGTKDATGAIDYTAADSIVGIDGRAFAWFDDPRRAIGYLRDRAGQTVSLTVEHADGSREELQTRLRDASQIEKGALGIGELAFAVGPDVQRDPLSALRIGGERTVDACFLVLNALRDLVGNLTQPQVSGPIGIATAVGTVRNEAPPIFLLYLMGLLSANLAVVNILPLPPMDGGRMAVSIIQALTRNRISVNAERATYLVGFMLLFAFLIWISYFDIQRLGT